MKEEIGFLKGVYAALNQLEVKGRENCATVVACMNSIEKVIYALERPKTEKEASNEKCEDVTT